MERDPGGGKTSRTTASASSRAVHPCVSPGPWMTPSTAAEVLFAAHPSAIRRDQLVDRQRSVGCDVRAQNLDDLAVEHRARRGLRRKGAHRIDDSLRRPAPVDGEILLGRSGASRSPPRPAACAPAEPLAARSSTSPSRSAPIAASRSCSSPYALLRLDRRPAWRARDRRCRVRNPSA